jgi:hypothetical protein
MVKRGPGAERISSRAQLVEAVHIINVLKHLLSSMSGSSNCNNKKKSGEVVKKLHGWFGKNFVGRRNALEGVKRLLHAHFSLVKHRKLLYIL